jgi:hypothetical protein
LLEAQRLTFGPLSSSASVGEVEDSIGPCDADAPKVLVADGGEAWFIPVSEFDAWS